MDHASFWLKTGTLHLPKWYMLLTEVVYTAYRNGTLSLPKTGTLLVTDYSGLGHQQYRDKLTALSTEKPSIDDTIAVQIGVLTAPNMLEMKKIATAEQYEKFMRFYPWMNDLPDLIILLLTCCAFSLVGSHILLLRTIANKKTSSEFPGHLAMIFSGFLIGLVVLGLSILLPRVLVSEGGTIQPSALMFLSLFGGMYSDALYSKLSKYVDKLFKNK